LKPELSVFLEPIIEELRKLENGINLSSDDIPKFKKFILIAAIFD